MSWRIAFLANMAHFLVCCRLFLRYFVYLCRRKYTKYNYNMRQVKPKKFLGQHFLTDLNTAQRIADTVDLCPDLPVLEVGPGMGVMTQFLMRKSRGLKVVELDYESVDYLRRTYPEFEDNIIEDDFLKMHLDRVFGGERFVLTGNYPYNISSQIFFKMLEYRDYIPCCTGMIQKEMAERLAAKPGSKAFGIITVLVQLWYDVEYLFTVPPTVFNPPPKVQSAVVCMRRNGVTDPGCNVLLLTRIVKQAFQQRRKMLRVSLKGLLPEGHEWGTLRPEQLSVEQFVCLTNQIDG